MEGSTAVEVDISKSFSANGPTERGWRMKGRNFFSGRAPSVSKGFKRIKERSPTIKDGLKKMTVKVEGFRKNARIKEGFNTAKGPVKKGLMKISSKAPPLKEGLIQGSVSLGKGITSVTSFTQDETKLLVSKAKRKLYCKSDWIDDPKLTATLDSVQTWEAVLDSQKNCLTRMIKHRRAFEESQRQLILKLQKVPANSGEYSKKSIELGCALESQVLKLIPTNTFEEMAQQIDKILSKYVELSALKRKYITAKIDVDVFTAKLESNEDCQKLQAEVVQAKQWCMQCKFQVSELATKIMEMKSEVLISTLLQVAGETTPQTTTAGFDIR